jgi:hypothetical protein
VTLAGRGRDRDGTFHLAAVKHIPGLISPDAGDFNNDGRLDVLTQHGVLPGNGDGSLQDLVPTFYVSIYGVSHSVGDFNGDGKLDVLSDPFLQLGNGAGTFQQGKSIDLMGEWHSTVVGDVNADGKLDVAVVSSTTVYDEYENPVTTTRFARVLLGYGDGSFAPAVSDLGTAPAISRFTSHVLADFDGDGFPDLAASEHDGDPGVYRGVYIALNDGNWTVPFLPPPAITIGDVTIIEGNTGTKAATFTVTLSAASSQPVSVAYATANGTATAGSDYQAAGTLTIPAGQRTGTVIVLVNGDRLAEPTETFAVNHSAPTNANIADAQGSAPSSTTNRGFPSLT